ncbi:hypothetical protein GCM10010520_60770 [Rhizobium viscosum]|uniref:Uncharacterized protein n=1 Tax=Rhizobium viscosum TaxID=1673 RepID=A0ABR9IUI8_RHIVS|nr:hypothetical protein [Rhizobium viscosum]MBE1506856.1 hypothetical protein [Rhizobium viscosum]
MKCISELLMGLAGATLVVTSAVQQAEANSDNGQDQSCEIVNVAYAATMNAARSSVTTYAEQDDGSLVFIADLRTQSGTNYLKDLTRKQWIRYPQTKWVPADRFGPKITDCVFKGDESHLGLAAKHYSAIRHELPQVSKVDFWITRNDARIVKMRIGPWGVKLKSGLGLIEIRKFDDEALPPPL